MKSGNLDRKFKHLEGNGVYFKKWKETNVQNRIKNEKSTKLRSLNAKMELRRWKIKREGCNTRTSQEVTHPSTTLAQARLTSEF